MPHVDLVGAKLGFTACLMRIWGFELSSTFGPKLKSKAFNHEPPKIDAKKRDSHEKMSPGS